MAMNMMERRRRHEWTDRWTRHCHSVADNLLIHDIDTDGQTDGLDIAILLLIICFILDIDTDGQTDGLDIQCHRNGVVLFVQFMCSNKIIMIK